MRVKICGIAKPEQGRAIARLGATALGFICVPKSPRYVTPEQIQPILASLPPNIDSIGVFADAAIADISQVVAQTNLTGVQLHGRESPEFCDRLRKTLPQVELIKALKIQTAESLEQAKRYGHCVDTLLLDAYHPHLLGGTGQTLNWQLLQSFQPQLPWLLAGGLTPENIQAALGQLHPDGIDLSSGVERSPGDKDLERVSRLFDVLGVLRGETRVNSKAHPPLGIPNPKTQ